MGTDSSTIKTINVEDEVIILKIDGEFTNTDETIEFYGFENEFTKTTKFPQYVPAYMVIKDKNGTIIAAQKGLIDGLSDTPKPMVFSLECNPENNNGLDAIGIIIMYNNKKKFACKMFSYAESYALAVAHKTFSFTAAQIKTLQNTRNSTYHPFTASINEKLTTVIVHDYDRSALNVDSIHQVLQSQLKSNK
ncbi:MAG: hypothetical protein QM504_03490 [Pseudomonadota bacterium]